MPEKQTFSLGDDGEIEVVDDPSWQDEKAKRSAPLWRRISRSSLIPSLVLAQTMCIGLLCVAIAFFALSGFDPIQMRCRILGMCPTPDTATRDAAGGVAFTTPISTSTPTPAVDLPCTARDTASPVPKIAFISDRRNPFGSAYLADLNGSSICRLLTNSEGLNNLNWSGNGHRLAFTTSRGIQVAQADGTAPHFLIGSVAKDERVHWSPDNQQVLYATDLPNGGMGIATIRADGTGQILLTNTSARDRAPGWSPDGRQIVFSSNRDGNTGIYVMNADGSKVRRLTPGLMTGEHPDWSPDGNRITFASDQDGDREIYMMNADGSDIRHLTGGQGRDDLPRWSPDGKQIVFVSYRDGNNEIYVMDAGGAHLRRLTSDRADDSRPVWLPGQTTQ